MTRGIPFTTPMAWLIVDGIGTRNRRLTAVRWGADEPMLWFGSMTDAIRHCREHGLVEVAAWIAGEPWTLTLTPELAAGDDAGDNPAASSAAATEGTNG